ncbi:MAG: MlaD family protein [Chitinophagales bacterium]|nr:MlaD family protein [Chitinophagales bacterium]
MKKNTNYKVRLGILITVGIALFVFAIYFIGSRQHLFSRTFEISAVFKDVNGLQVGNNVRFSGITVGTVSKVEIISDTTVRVSLVIEDRTQQFIKKDATAVISSDGLMGNKVMTINPGTAGAGEIEDNDVLATIQPVNMDDIMLKIKMTADNAALITSDLATVMNSVSMGKGTIGKLFMDSTLAETLDQTLMSVKGAAEGMDENMEAAKSNFLLKGYYNKKEKELEKEKEFEQKEKETKDKD